MIARIYISGPIGFPPDDYSEEMGTTLADVRRQFNSFDDVTEVTAYINSPGGDVREGFAIHDFLNTLSVPVTTVAEGRAWSIASVIFLAGSKRMIAPNATVMIHNPLTGMFGNAEELREAADYLDGIGTTLAEFYAQKTGQEIGLLSDMMNAETELNAADSVSLGFATEVMKAQVALAWINHNNTDMEKKESVLDRLKKFLVAEGAAVETPAPTEPEVAETPAPVEDENKELEEAAAKIAELEAKLKASEDASTKQAELLEAVAQKLEEIEKQPLVTKRTPVPNAGNQASEKTLIAKGKLTPKFEEYLSKLETIKNQK